MSEKLRPAPPEIDAKLNQAMEEFKEQASFGSTPQALERGCDLYAVIAGLEDEKNRAVYADSTKPPRPILPDLVELRKRLRGENYDHDMARAARKLFISVSMGDPLGKGIKSTLSGLRWGELQRASHFCWEMLER